MGQFRSGWDPVASSDAFDGEHVLPRLLKQAIASLDDLGPDYSLDRKTVYELSVRLLGGQFHLAVLGQFKRGKSTLLNALLGEPVLPTSVVPLTAIPTFIRSGPLREATVRFEDGRPAEGLSAPDCAAMTAFLARFVSEPGNPRNRLGVSQVELLHPGALLRKGVVLIDTPGIGSTLRHNTETTLKVLSQCDAAVFLISADPPITDVELKFLRHVSGRVARLFFVLNKVDYLGPEEVREALQFHESVLAKQAGVPPEVFIFPVSARLGLRSKAAGDGAGWAQSGMDRVERHLTDFLAAEKAAVLRKAVAQKAADVLATALLRLKLTVRALQLPLADLQARLALFEQELVEIRRDRSTLKDLLAGDERRMREYIETEYERIRGVAAAKLDQVVAATMKQSGTRLPDERGLHEILDGVLPEIFSGLFAEVTTDVEGRLAEVVRPHQKRADALIASVRQAAANLFEVPLLSTAPMESLGPDSAPYWKTHQWDQSFGPISPGLIDRLLPRRLRYARVERRFRNKIAALVLRNSGQLREALSGRLDKAFARLGKELEQRLAKTKDATLGAIRSAMTNRDRTASDANREIPRMSALASDLNDLKVKLDAVAHDLQVSEAPS